MKKLVIILIAVLPLLSACMEMQSVYDNPGKELLAVSAVSGVPTKAPVPGSTFSTSRVMTLSAWYNAPESGTSENYFSAQTFRYNSESSLWKASDCYWPLQGTLSLLAWSIDDGTNSLTPTAINWVSSNYTDGVTLALPDNSTKQVDVMFAGKADATKNNNALVFKHALSWLEFQVTCNTPDVITLTGITVRNVYHSGSLTAARSGDEVEFSWKSLATQEDRNVAFSPIALDASWQMVGNGMLIPPQLQILNAGMKTCFVVHYTVPYGDGGAPIAKSRICYFGDDAWEPGIKYIYKLNFTLDNLTVTTEVTPWANVVEPVNPVEVDMADLSLFDVSGNYLGASSTANCYVVRNTGTFHFPLVYGNSIKAGAVNSAAYTSLGGTYQADFVNHLGNTLTSPYIESNAGCTAASAGLLWQTAPDLITSVSLVDGGPCRYLEFNVGNVPASNGLAVLYVKDTSGDIMWSWMIWLTGDTLKAERVTNYQGVDYLLLNEDLGAIWNADRNRCTIPYYQWGRKDPMPPAANWDSDEDATLYDLLGNVYSGYGVQYGSTVDNAIKNPNLFLKGGSEGWNSLSSFCNYWNASLNTDNDFTDDQNTAVKTIYDPCPVGWMIPASRAFTGFSTTGEGGWHVANVVGDFDNGYYFKRNSDDVVGMFFQASGGRNYYTDMINQTGSTTFGYRWTFAPYSQDKMFLFVFGNNGGLYCYPSSFGGPGHCYPIRPCREP